MQDGRWPRRRVLGVSLAALSLAGCSGDGRDETTGETGDLRSMGYGETRESSLDADDGRDPLYDELSEPVAFDGALDDSVSVLVSAEGFDAYLVLQAPDGTVVGEGSGESVGFNTPMRTVLTQSGSYRVWVGSVSGDATGSYSITLEKRGTASVTDLRSIAVGETRSGFIDADEAGTRDTATWPSRSSSRARAAGASASRCARRRSTRSSC